MSHRTRIRPNMAAWANASAVTQAEYEALDAGHFSAIDGDAGGIWIPLAKIILGGIFGLDVVAPFVARGASAFIPSLQAQNWPERSSVSSATTGNNSDVPIAYAPASSGVGYGGNGLIVALTTNGTASAVSDDGTVWTAGTSFGGFTGTAQDIAYGLIAAGTPGFLVSSSTSGALVKSADGAAWTAIAGGASVIGTSSVLCYAGSLTRWVAAGAAGVVYTSDDYGATWTSRATPAPWIAGSGGAKRVVWNGSLFVALPSLTYSKFLTSPDGITWTERTVANTRWVGLAWGAWDSVWIAVAGGSTQAYKSADGLTWVTCSPTGVLGQAQDLAVNGPLWVVTGIVNTLAPPIAWSVDAGATWQGVSVGNHRTATAGYKRVILADNRFVAVHANGASLEFALSLRTS